jgi:hypothetical protein
LVSEVIANTSLGFKNSSNGVASVDTASLLTRVLFDTAVSSNGFVVKLPFGTRVHDQGVVGAAGGRAMRPRHSLGYLLSGMR